MKQFIEFVTHHLVLWGALVIAVTWLIYEEISSKIGGSPRLLPKDATILMNHEDTVVVDLRAKPAFVTGHILSSINIPQAELTANMQKLEAHKTKSILLVDTMDTSLVNIGKKLAQEGFAKVFILSGGLTAWKEAGLPLVKK